MRTPTAAGGVDDVGARMARVYRTALLRPRDPHLRLRMPVVGYTMRNDEHAVEGHFTPSQITGLRDLADTRW